MQSKKGYLQTKWQAVAATAALLLLTACASNPFVSTWRDPDAQPLMVNGARIAAIAMVESESSRRAAEDAIARELEARGAIGVPLYTVLPNASPSNEAEVREQLEQQGFQGVVVFRPVNSRTEVLSDFAYASPNYRVLWGGYYGYGWGTPWGVGVTAQPDIRSDNIVTVETLVYSLRQNKLVWGGESTIRNPSGVERMVRDTAKKVAAELQRIGLLEN
ncbi:MAG TPA: hypothetical protein VNR18_04935 [Hyphomicrobiales bacterium]|nr:hypothetical protein [Hyphomicrobiales bacterium]